MAEYTQVVIITLANGERAEFSGPIQIRPTDQMILVQWENRPARSERPPLEADQNARDWPRCRACRTNPQKQPGGHRGLCELCAQALIEGRFRKKHRRAAGATKD